MKEIKFRFWNGDMMLYYDLFSIPKNLNYIDIPMQYVGLKDKNGKEIYEGDVVKVIYSDSLIEFSHIGFIKFSITSLQYGIQSKSGLFKPFSEYYYKEIEVIGNVYENPELLEGD